MDKNNVEVNEKMTRSCADCKHSYVDNLFYEWCCDINGLHPVLDEYGDTIEGLKCKRFELEEKNE